MRYIGLPKTKPMTLEEYREKFLEELVELMEEFNYDDVEAFVSEYFDVVQSGMNYFEARGVNMNASNLKHIKKLEDRGIVK